MARKLKTYQTSLGFFDLAIAAPSMKAALEAWGADSNLFHQGVAKESDDPDVVAATLAKPGVILRRPVGSDGPFREHTDLPRLSGNESDRRRARSRAKPKKQPPRRPTTRRAARPPWSMREPKGNAKPDGGRKRPSASRPAPRRRPLSIRQSESMTRGQGPSKPSAPRWKSARKRRTPVGRSKRRSCRPLNVGRANRY